MQATVKVIFKGSVLQALT